MSEYYRVYQEEIYIGGKVVSRRFNLSPVIGFDPDSEEKGWETLKSLADYIRTNTLDYCKELLRNQQNKGEIIERNLNNLEGIEAIVRNVIGSNATSVTLMKPLTKKQFSELAELLAME